MITILLYLSIFVTPPECWFYQNYGEIQGQNYIMEYTLTKCTAIHNDLDFEFQVKKSDAKRERDDDDISIVAASDYPFVSPATQK